MATTVTKYVDPNSATGGDGTTNGLTGATRAYASLSAWEAANQADIVTSDTIQKVICSSDDAGATHAADTTAVVIDGWTTDATRFIQIEAASSHGGKWNDNIYRFVCADLTSAHALYINESYVRLVRVQASLSGANSRSTVAIYGTGASNASLIVVDSCIIKGSGSQAGYGHGIRVLSGTCDIMNSVIYNCVEAGIAGTYGTAWPTINIYSSTLCNNGANGIKRLSADARLIVNAKNVYSGGHSAEDYGVSGGTITKTACASSDATGTAGLQNIAVNTTNFTNVTAGSEDFHLPAGSALIDVGTDTSGDAAPLNFSDDIDGVARTGTWDIGADEYVAAGGGVSITPTIGSLSASGAASQNDRGIFTPTEVNIA